MAGIAALLVAACGGGGGDGEGVGAPISCSATDRKAWLGAYFDDWYFWYRLSPRPSPAAYATPADYFGALLFAGSPPTFPADRWSGWQSTESFNRFYGDGATLGYGLGVNGIEAVERGSGPLLVRYVEPLGPAAAAGVRRGDEVVSINGRSAASLIAADDFGALTANASGDRLTLVLRSGGADRTVSVTAAVFTLTPVSGAAVMQSPGGRRIGYLFVNQMIAQAGPGLEAAFATFRAQAVQDLVLDMRYNGGGLVSMGATLASYVAGTRGLNPGGSAKVFASLLYNDKRAAAQNVSYGFESRTSALGVSRVFVLAGPRTCSATEQVINALRGIDVDVVAIGDTTCGKPVGFLPRDDSCGTTYSIVNFESVNARNEGRYFDGFLPTCPVAENHAFALGDPAEPLLLAARRFADGNACPVGGAASPAVSDGTMRALGAARSAADGVRRSRGADGGERPAMLPR